MAGTRIEVTGLTTVAAILGQLADFDPAPAYDEMGQYIVSEITQEFRDGKGPDGEPWEASRRAADGGGKTLVDRGHLRDSYTSQVTADGLAVGSNDKRARLHQFGGVVRPKRALYLSIPLTPAAGEYSSPRQFPEPLHVIETEKGAFLATADGTPQYSLRRSVTMPARPVLPEGDLPPAWREEVLDIVQAHLEGAFRG